MSLLLLLDKGGGAFAGAYDDFESSLAHVYEPARRTLTSYIGNLCRLRRASDDAELDFGYLDNDNLDVASIAAWAGGASYIVTMYDQKGSDDLTQSTKADQPLFVASAQNGHAGAFYDGINTNIGGAFAVGGALSQPCRILTACSLDATAIGDGIQRHIVDGDDNANRIIILKNAGGDLWQEYAGAVLSTAISAGSSATIISSLLNGASGYMRINQNQTNGNVGILIIDGLVIGARYDGASNHWKGLSFSCIVINAVLSEPDNAALENKLNSYWEAY